MGERVLVYERGRGSVREENVSVGEREELCGRKRVSLCARKSKRERERER